MIFMEGFHDMGKLFQGFLKRKKFEKYLSEQMKLNGNNINFSETSSKLKFWWILVILLLKILHFCCYKLNKNVSYFNRILLCLIQ